ncbi:YdcF family protein [Marinicrinis lubricantis]
MGKLVAIIMACGLFWTGYVQWQIHTTQDSRLEEPVDAGIVLGAALWNGVPSPALKERLDHALALYNDGSFRKFIVSGGYDVPGARYTEAEGMKNYLVEHGVPPEDVLLENQATSTYENIKLSKEIMDDHRLSTAVIITHSYHGARAKDIAQFLQFEPAIVSTTPSKVMNMAWHQFRETLAFTKWQLDKLQLSLKGEH